MDSKALTQPETETRRGTADARVPLAVSAAYKRRPVSALPGIGHFELIDPEHAAASPACGPTHC